MIEQLYTRKNNNTINSRDICKVSELTITIFCFKDQFHTKDDKIF